MIQISDVTVRFGGVLALDQITAGFSEDIVGVIGPNGAGKTTLINVFSGFVKPERGSVMFGDTDLLALPPHRRARWGLARSFQKVENVEILTATDMVRVALDSRSIPATDRHAAIERSLEFVGLSDLADVRGAVLNPYQQRMVEIARCLAASPKIVLLDEPGGGLSAFEVNKLRKIIEGIRPHFGAQVLLIDHDVDLIRAVCSKTMVLDFGKLIAFGETGSVLKDEKVKAAYLGKDEGE